MNPIIVLLSISVFFAACLAIAHYGKLKTGRTVEEFFIAGRSIGSFIAALTYSATTYSAFMMVGLVGLTAIHGVGALGFELVYMMGLMLAVAFGLRFYAAGKRWGLVTPAQLLSVRYGSSVLGLVTALLYHVFLIPYMSIQLIGAGVLLNGITKGAIPFEVGVLTLATVVFVYTIWGGMRAVAWTDALQALLMLTSSLLMLFIAFQLAGGIGSVFTKLLQEPEILSVPGPYNYFTITTFISLTVPWFFFSVSNPQVVQRFYIPKSVKALKNMLRGFLIFGFTYTIIVTMLGLIAHILVPWVKDQNMVTPTLLTMVPEPIAILVLIGILAAGISTLDSILLTLSSEFAINVVRTVKPSCSELTALRAGRAFMSVILVAIIFFSFTRGPIVQLAVTSSSWLLQLVPAFIAALVWSRANKISACLSIASGVVVMASLTLLGVHPLGVDPGIWGLMVATIAMIVPSLVLKADERGIAFKRALNEELKKLLK
ncbi:MAG: sodium:solute symporter family protein [Candidatus Nezhaarchaeota archaeon]|nr:sodium:solute symporter family protein [Candidatus Nezhaarchaeota archaeon]MDW8050610.1 sodium:solute symporter family protein [Nitrososphaerota archaeon]